MNDPLDLIEQGCRDFQTMDMKPVSTITRGLVVTDDHYYYFLSDEAKVYHERVAVYWYVRPAQNADSRVQVTFQLGSTTHPVVQEVERLNRAVALSRARSPAAHYDVALSFAGEDRKYVHRVAEALAEKGVKVFYDNFEEADLWGKYL